MKDFRNPYRAARMQAAGQDGRLFSRERAAGELYVSVEALKGYETGATLPPCDVVERMVEVYEAPELKRQHIRAACPLLPDYGSAQQCYLTHAALSWAVELSDARDSALRFAALARDGAIDPEEIAAAKQIRAKAVVIRQIMEDAITAIDDAMKGVSME